MMIIKKNEIIYIIGRIEKIVENIMEMWFKIIIGLLI